MEEASIDALLDGRTLGEREWDRADERNEMHRRMVVGFCARQQLEDESLLLMQSARFTFYLPGRQSGREMETGEEMGEPWDIMWSDFNCRCATINGAKKKKEKGVTPKVN